MMSGTVFMLLRRMRLPLIILISSYAISIVGFVTIPGQDDLGNVWKMDFFHAFYFVSFMGSTIGFGEIPYPFTDAQRLWTTFALYSTVISWLYAIGALLSITQSRAFKQVISQARFNHSVDRISEPFYIVCGYGDVSFYLLNVLFRQGIRVVVIDNNQVNIDNLEIADLSFDTPALCADAAESESLIAAGLNKDNCKGVLALTDQDEVNLMVAIAAKLIVPDIFVICRAENQDSEVNMASFGTDYIVNPYSSFADRLSMAIQSPKLFLLTEWLTDNKYRANDTGLAPPKGRWIICGYGRFGKCFEKYLSYVGCETTIIEAEPKKTNAPNNAIVGRGTEAVTLREAEIEQAVGIIAGTDNDPNNLSIIMTAQELNSDLFCVIRQNHDYNQTVFSSAKCHWVMQPGRIVARKVLSRINMPLLFSFLHVSRREKEEWTSLLVEKISTMLGENLPHCWSQSLNQYESPAFAALSTQHTIPLATIIKDPSQQTRNLLCVPLLLKREDQIILLPDENTELQIDDALLFCGHESSELLMTETLDDIYLLIYLITGQDQPRGSLLRRLKGLPSMPKIS